MYVLLVMLQPSLAKSGYNLSTKRGSSVSNTILASAVFLTFCTLSRKVRESNIRREEVTKCMHSLLLVAFASTLTVRVFIRLIKKIY